MEITPDTKDWTWVLERPCPECGLDTREVQRDDISRLIRENAAQWVVLLRESDEVSRRSSPAVWSPLEYACHVRDVFRLFDQRLQRMLAEDDPLFANWDQDATAMAERYWEQDPVSVSAQLHEAAEHLATRFESVSGAAWARPGRRSDGARFTVETFGRYLVHDPIHHLYDVTGETYRATPSPQT
jgi:hypothetical protein